MDIQTGFTFWLLRVSSAVNVGVQAFEWTRIFSSHVPSSEWLGHGDLMFIFFTVAASLLSSPPAAHQVAASPDRPRARPLYTVTWVWEASHGGLGLLSPSDAQWLSSRWWLFTRLFGNVHSKPWLISSPLVGSFVSGRHAGVESRHLGLIRYDQVFFS